MKSLFFAVTFAASLSGCAALNLAHKINTVDGFFRVTNTLSVPVCDVVVQTNHTPERDEHDLAKTPLMPGETSNVDRPRISEMGQPAPADTVYTLQVYGCQKGNFTMDRGGLLLTMQNVDASNKTPVAIH